ncbi:MAG: beta-lactamase family protein, partial [Chloroflexi bacterium]|nr:beta-lactamase family protein [Chloroflexota bacterium]
ILLAACGGPVAVEPTALDLQGILADNADPQGPATVAVVVTPAGTVSAAVGRFDTAGGNRLASTQDTFRIGSVSKMFTAVAALQLVDDGVLSLDDTAADWLDPAVIDGVANADRATVEQLLNHTSGVPDYLDDAFFAEAYAANRIWRADETLDYAAGYLPGFAPGAGFEYSNTNYILLHLIVEAAGGAPLHTAIRQGILTPLALEDTYTQISEQGTAPARGYEDVDGDGRAEDVTMINDGAGLGDGGLISSGADVAAFLQALVLDGDLLSAELTDAMLADYGGEYGLGIEVIDSPWGPQIGHGGAVTGYEALAYTFPTYETTVVVLTGSFGAVELTFIVDEIMDTLYP